MKKSNLKVIKKILKNRCWVCNGKGCKICHYTGIYKETFYYHIIQDKDKKQYCISGDSLK